MFRAQLQREFPLYQQSSISLDPIGSQYLRLFIYESRSIKNFDGLDEPTIDEIEAYFVKAEEEE